MRKKLLAIIATAAMVVTMIPTMAFAGSTPTITATGLDDEIVVGKTANFKIGISGGDNSTMVVGTSSFSGDAAIESIEYKEGSTWKNLAHDGDGAFGADTGFPFPEDNVEVDFRVKFKAAGSFDMEINIVPVADKTNSLAKLEKTIKVVDPVKPSIKTTLKDTINIGDVEEFEISIEKGNLYNGVMVKGITSFDGDAAIDKLQYKEGTEWKDLPVDGDGKGSFGPATGFPLMDAKSEFKASFKTAGTYTMKVDIVDVETGEVLTSLNKTIKVVDPKAVPEKSPNTGDDNMAPFAVAGLVMAAMAAVVATRRRTN